MNASQCYHYNKLRDGHYRPTGGLGIVQWDISRGNTHSIIVMLKSSCVLLCHKSAGRVSATIKASLVLEEQKWGKDCREGDCIERNTIEL